MTDSNRDMTRRDWFRLKLPHQNQTLGDSADHPDAKTDLQAVELPPNHHGMDMNELPPMREAILDPSQVEMLFADIGKLATNVQLFQRSARAQARASNTRDSDLSLAKESLQNGKVARMQIRYQWQDARWIDTLESRPEGTRLVRILHVEQK